MLQHARAEQPTYLPRLHFLPSHYSVLALHCCVPLLTSSLSYQIPTATRAQGEPQSALWRSRRFRSRGNKRWEDDESEARKGRSHKGHSRESAARDCRECPPPPHHPRFFFFFLSFFLEHVFGLTKIHCSSRPVHGTLRPQGHGRESNEERRQEEAKRRQPAFEKEWRHWRGRVPEVAEGSRQSAPRSRRRWCRCPSRDWEEGEEQGREEAEALNRDTVL